MIKQYLVGSTSKWILDLCWSSLPAAKFNDIKLMDLAAEDLKNLLVGGDMGLMDKTFKPYCMTKGPNRR